MFVRGHTTEFKLTDGLKQAIETAQVEYKELVKALEISYLLYPRLQGNKNKDVMMQAAFQVSPPPAPPLSTCVQQKTEHYSPRIEI